MPVCPSRCVLHVLDAAFNADLRRHGVNSRRVERRRQADRLRIFRHALVDDAVQSFAPPLVRRNLQPRHRGGVVLHLRRLLRQRHAAYQVRRALLR